MKLTPRGQLLLDVLKVLAIVTCFIIAGVYATHSPAP